MASYRDPFKFARSPPFAYGDDHTDAAMNFITRMPALSEKYPRIASAATLADIQAVRTDDSTVGSVAHSTLIYAFVAAIALVVAYYWLRR